MALTVDDVTRIARLARIKVPDGDKAALAKDLSGIMTWIDQLQQVNTDQVPHYSDYDIHEMSQRDDLITDGNYVDNIMANAPEKAHNMFAVPKVVE